MCDWVDAEYNVTGEISDWSKNGENVSMADINLENDRRELTDTKDDEILLGTIDHNDNYNRNTCEDFFGTVQ